MERKNLWVNSASRRMSPRLAGCGEASPLTMLMIPKRGER